MYVKVFSQILESSIAVDYEQRHVFEDILKLADREGVVDMTHEAIARRVNVPEPIIRRGISKLEEPDPLSRSEECEGRRIVRLAPHREWGWQIVNYVFYRDLIDAEALRAANRERKREQRARDRARHEMSQNVRDKSQRSQNVTLSESDRESDTNSPKKKKKASRPASPEEFRDYCDAYCKEQNKSLGNWTHLLDRFLASGWKLSRGQPVSDWKAHARNYINNGWHLNGNQIQAALPITATKPQYITRDMIDEWCYRKKYSKLAPIAWGKLMGGKHFGVAIDNEEDFDAAMSSILADWLRTP